jgi:hypothetical protein
MSWTSGPRFFLLTRTVSTKIRWIPVTTTCSSLGCGLKDGLQLWRVAADVLNKQPRIKDKGWSSSLRFGLGANNTSPQKINLLLKRHRSLGLGRIATASRSDTVVMKPPIRWVDGIKRSSEKMTTDRVEPWSKIRVRGVVSKK